MAIDVRVLDIKTLTYTAGIHKLREELSRTALHILYRLVCISGQCGQQPCRVQIGIENRVSHEHLARIVLRNTLVIAQILGETLAGIHRNLKRRILPTQFQAEIRHALDTARHGGRHTVHFLSVPLIENLRTTSV